LSIRALYSCCCWLACRYCRADALSVRVLSVLDNIRLLDQVESEQTILLTLALNARLLARESYSFTIRTILCLSPILGFCVSRTWSPYWLLELNQSEKGNAGGCGPQGHVEATPLALGYESIPRKTLVEQSPAARGSGSLLLPVLARLRRQYGL
jgi:hypothetical protein